MRKNSILFCLLFLGSLINSSAQNTGDKYTPEKLRQSFENIQTIDGKVFYEQRLYRNPFIGLYEIQKVTADTTIKQYVPLFNGFPIGKYAVDENVNYDPLSDAERKAYLQKNRFLLHKKYKADFWIQPYFAAIFGNFEKPVESNTSGALQTQLYLLPGLTLQTGVLFPIVNDLDGRPKNIRLAPTFLNQFYNQGSNYISASAGFFQNDQYGVNVQYRRADLSKPWSFGLEAGLTGFYYYPKGGIYYEGPDQLLLLADASYRFKGPDITLKLSGGQFLWRDKGARIEMVRQFTNVELGVYAVKTQNGSTLGFNFAVPIPPGKIVQGKHARLRTTDEFRWEYTYSRGYRIGERYRLGYQLDQKLRQFHQDYLNRQHREL
ncbi:YjbH domain-containing protein [Dyadobacter sp. CY312]|uniref:YjbH domain-containing protein n=1 Tax=Dyadobacter sp. CY312 TaxID=2907303 RepID=UPI001F487A87|nr:YjbH domain-containing protein [Dyadobacter sp. CY312]MCE7040492.1 YjbH domain-containing protein [Dyadobacter sp. CY312]